VRWPTRARSGRRADASLGAGLHALTAFAHIVTVGNLQDYKFFSVVRVEDLDRLYVGVFGTWFPLSWPRDDAQPADPAPRRFS